MSEQPKRPELWRDPANYTTPARCHECRQVKPTGWWGQWCHPCNVERMERIGSFLERAVKGER